MLELCTGRFVVLTLFLHSPSHSRVSLCGSQLVVLIYTDHLRIRMSDPASPVGSPANESIDDGQEKEFQDEVAAADSDRESDALSEIDENEFEDYDPETANIEDRPVDIDEDIARTLKASKRKRITGDAPKKPREGRREKKRRDDNDDAPMEDGAADTDGKSQRRSRRPADGERRRAAKPDAPAPENEEELSPEERRKRAIDRALDAAIKKTGTSKRRRKDEIVRSRPQKHQRASRGHFKLTWRRRIWKTKSMTSSPNSRFEWRRHVKPTIQHASPDVLPFTS